MNTRTTLIVGSFLLAALAGTQAQPALKDVFKDDFMIGAAVNQRQVTGMDANGAALVQRQFNSVSPENVMKWESIHPRPGPDGYDFSGADRYVEFGEKNGMFVVGHCLIWHSQTPRWVFQGEGTNAATREVLLQRMHDHIQTVVGRYKGRIKCWDVVNEALNEDGSLRQSPWFRIIGEDYLAKAFEFAHEADPAAELRYNDYSIENAPKRRGTVTLVKKLQAQKAPISGLGSQTHANLNWPSAQLLDDALTEFAALGLPISITELDVDASQRGQRNQSADVAQNAQAGGGGTVDAANQRLADQYASLFRVFLKHRKNLKLVTFWGVTDRDSWRRAGNPLLFDGQWKPKPAFDAVVALAGKSPTAGSQPSAHAKDTNFWIFLCFGQSNMEGFPGLQEQDKSGVNERFKMFAAVDFPQQDRKKGSWYPAVPPLCRPGNGIGPADYFGRTLVSNLPRQIKVGVVNVAVAGCKIELFELANYQAYASNAAPWMKNIIKTYDGNPYHYLVEMAKLAQQDGVIKGIVLHQGESNTGDKEWPNKVKGIYDKLLADLSLKAADVPLIAGEVVGADQKGACASMNQIIADLPKAIPTAHVVSSAGCAALPDHLHFTPAGYRELGTRYGLKMLPLLGYKTEAAK